MNGVPDAWEDYRSFPDLLRLPLGESQALVYCPWLRTARAVSPLGLRLLQGCARFASLEAHAARLCQELNLGPQQEAVRQELLALAGAGLLVSRRRLADACSRLAAGEPPTRITTVGIPTRDRPENLRTCLLELLQRNRRHGRSPTYTIVDDSEDVALRQTNREFLCDIAERFSVYIVHAGPGEKAHFAAALAQEAGLPLSDVRFGLVNEERWPIGTGGSRNALLLHAVGDLLLQVDDDTQCQLTPCPGRLPGLALSSAHDPTEFWFFEEQGQALDQPGETDLLGIHEQLLGRRVSDCLAAAGSGEELDLGQCGAGFFRRLDTGESRVLTTLGGVVGDSGMGSPLALLMLEGPSRDRLLRSEGVFHRAVRQRECLRAVRRTTVGEGAFCMAPNLGLDGRGLLPPFPPAQRTQDGVFGVVLRACFGSSFTGLLPWALRHRAPAARVTPESLWQAAVRVHTGHLLQVLVRAWPVPPIPVDSAQGLRSLGSWLADLATARIEDFEEYVQLQIWNYLGRGAGQLEILLRNFRGQPTYWADATRSALAALRESLDGVAFARPWDLGGEQSGERFRRLVGGYGRLLQLWPALFEAARRLRVRGVRLAQPVRGALKG